MKQLGTTIKKKLLMLAVRTHKFGDEYVSNLCLFNLLYFLRLSVAII